MFLLIRFYLKIGSQNSEAILNSRPLTSESDPRNVDCLSSGYFLVGISLLSVPEVPIAENRRVKDRKGFLKKKLKYLVNKMQARDEEDK